MPSEYRGWRMKFRFVGKEKRRVFGSYRTSRAARWRSTFSTVMNELAGVESRGGVRAIIDLLLAHVPSNSVEAAYNRA